MGFGDREHDKESRKWKERGQVETVLKAFAFKRHQNFPNFYLTSSINFNAI